MKRLVSALLVFCLVFSFAMAEEEDSKSIWDSIGDLFDQAAEQASDWVSEFWTESESWVKDAWGDSSEWIGQAWGEASEWIGQAWGDASEWIGQAWGDSSEWVSEIWGDVSSWAVDSYSTVSGKIGAWWDETFRKTTEIDEAWVSDDAVAQAFHSLQEYLIKYKINTLLNGKASVHDVIVQLLANLQLNEEDTQKVLDTIRAYAAEKGISAAAMEAVMLPYLLQLTIDSESLGNADIPAVAVAQYLTGAVEKLGIKTEEEAQLLAKRVYQIFAE